MSLPKAFASFSAAKVAAAVIGPPNKAITGRASPNSGLATTLISYVSLIILVVPTAKISAEGPLTNKFVVKISPLSILKSPPKVLK